MKKLLLTILIGTLALSACSSNGKVDELYEKAQIKELIDTFSNLADVKDAKSQGDLFLEDGKLEFQMGFDGAINNIEGREALVNAFARTINPCKAVYHINGQSNVTFTNSSLTEATGIAYCTATLVNEVNGKDIGTTNYVRYSDNYVKQNGKWYIKTRRTTFITSDTFEMNTARVETNTTNNENATNENSSQININANLTTAVGEFDLNNKLVKLNSGYNMPTSGIGVFGIEPADAERAVEYSLRNGNRLIDTANAYMNEKAVGRAIKKSGVPREEIFLTTKLWVTEYGRAKEAIDETLKRLDTDYIDLLLLHQPYGQYLDAWKAMEDAVKEGKVKSIGLSNFYQDKFKEIMNVATINPAVLQIEVNPTVAQDNMIEFCKEYGTVVEAWFPLAGRGHTEILLDNEIIKEIATAHGKSPAQIVLRWHLQHGDIAIPGSKTESHILENINIYDFSLTDEEMARIKTIDTNAFQFPYDGNDDAEMEERYTSRVWNFDDQE